VLGKEARHEIAVQELAKFKLSPKEPFPGFKTKWKCQCIECGNEVNRSLQVLRKSNFPCPHCKLKTFKSPNRIEESEAISIMNSSGFEPLEPYISTGTPWKSKCLECGEISSPRFGNVRSLRSGCKNCNRNQTSQMEIKSKLSKNDIELVGIYKSSKSLSELKCKKCGLVFKAKVQNVLLKKEPCPNCALQKRSEFIEEVEEVFRTSGVTPQEDYINSSTPRKSICNKCLREVTPSLNTLRAGHAGCKYCAGVAVDVEDALRLMNDRGYQPLEPFVSGKTLWRSLCTKCGNECYPRYANIRSGLGGCVTCGKVNRAEKRKLSQEEALEVMLSNGLKPLEPYLSSKTPWLCECMTCGNEVHPMLNTVQQGDGGCGYCAKNLVNPVEAIEFMKSNGFTPLVDYPGANLPWQSTHDECGNVVSPRYASIKRGGTCKFCTNKGFQFHLPGYIYLITHSELRAHKVGIATSEIRQDRLKVHFSHGWELYKSKQFNLGNNAYLTEQATIDWLRKVMYLPQFLEHSQMPQGGWTETVSADEIDLPTIWKMVLEFSKNHTEAEN
jgi:hypothetical protein